MQIFFTAMYPASHQEIISTLRKMKGSTLALAPVPPMHDPLHKNVFINQTNLLKSLKNYYQTYQSIQHCDICIAETTLSSARVDYQIALALDLKKPVILLYQKKTPLLTQQSSLDLVENLHQVNYTVKNISKKLTALFSSLHKLSPITGI